MTALELAEKCFQRFNDLARDVDDETRWSAAEELIACLEGILMERDEQAS